VLESLQRFCIGPSRVAIAPQPKCRRTPANRLSLKPIFAGRFARVRCASSYVNQSGRLVVVGSVARDSLGGERAQRPARSSGVVYVFAQRCTGDLADGAVLLTGTGAQGLGEVGVDANLYAR
jgi:hypothetical protein